MSFAMMVHAIQIIELRSDFSCSLATVQQRTAQNFLGVLKTSSGGKDRKYLKTNQKLMVAYRMSISTFLLSISFEQSVEML